MAVTTYKHSLLYFPGMTDVKVFPLHEWAALYSTLNSQSELKFEIRLGKGALCGATTNEPPER